MNLIPQQPVAHALIVEQRSQRLEDTDGRARGRRECDGRGYCGFQSHGYAHFWWGENRNAIDMKIPVTYHNK
jgi:hypothetical protein